jgi:alkylation response protein AidB-like acyl-CoA dehydrogenase
MFDLGIEEELELLVETARSFAQDELAPKLRDFEKARGVDEGVMDSFSQIGLAGLEVPESLGGAGLGAVARILVNEELAVADAGAALALDTLGPALYPLQELGGESALQELAMPLLEREGARALLITGGDAELQIDGSSASGRVPWVPADRVDLLVILDSGGAVAIREGIQTERLRGSGLRAAGASELRLDSAPIAGRWRDPPGAARALARARLYNASLIVGILHQAAEFSRNYALERTAFGRPIAHHQALAFLITDMRMAVDGARLLVQEAAWQLDRGLPGEALAAMAFAEAIEASRFVGPNGIQILGGHGFVNDYPVEKYMREARTLGLMLGGIDAAREDAGRALCESEIPVSLSYVETS